MLLPTCFLYKLRLFVSLATNGNTLSFLCLIFVFDCYAQNNNKILWDERSGLSNNSVKAIIQDNDGFLWIGTEYGLNKFNGSSFLVYFSKERNQLISNSVSGLHKLTNGNIAVIYDGGGLSFIDQKQETFTNYYPGQNGFPKQKVTTVFEDLDGSLWLGFQHSGLYRMRDSVLTHISNIDSKRNTINSIKRVRGYLWLATSNGLYRWDDKKDSLIEIINTNDHNKTNYNVLTLSGDVLWLGSWTGGIDSYDLNTGNWNRYLYSNPCEDHCLMNIVRDIEIHNDSILMIATYDKGFVKFDVTTKQFYYFEEWKGMPLITETIWPDKQGNIWVGTTGGLVQIEPLLAQFQFNDRITHTNTFCFDSVRNLLVVGTIYSDGLKLYDLANNTVRTLALPMPAKAFEKAPLVLSIQQRANGDVYVLTKYSVCKLDYSSYRLVPILEDFEFSDMKMDARSNIWVSTFKPWENKQQTKIFKLLPDNSIETYYSMLDLYSITVAGGHVWFVGKDGLLLYSNETSKFTSWSIFDKGSKLPASSILTGTVTNDTLWIGGTFGLMKAWISSTHTLEVKPYSENEKLNKRIVKSMLSDARGNLWFITGSYVGKIENKTGKFGLFSFTAARTDDMSNYYTLSETWMKGEQFIFISDYKGFYSFKPHEIQVDDNMPIFKVKEASVPGTLLHSDFDLRNAATVRDRTLNILFEPIYYGDHNRISLAYKIEGVDADWVYFSPKNYFIHRANLPRDVKLKLLIKFCNQNTQWGDIKVINFVIPSPVWERPWFIMLMGLALLILIGLIVRASLSRLRNREKEKYNQKMRLYQAEIKALRSQLNPHFIFNSLNAIQDQVLSNKPEQALEYLGKFSSLMRIVLRNSDKAFVKLSEELYLIELYLTLEAIRFKNQFKWSITLGEGIDTDLTNIPTLLLQPFIENAIIHGLLNKNSNPTLELSFIIEGERLIVLLVDNGVGILRSEADRKHYKFQNRDESRGVNLIKDRLQVLNAAYHLNASITIKDRSLVREDLNGTEVMISIDLNGLKL